jgi:putative transposase
MSDYRKSAHTVYCLHYHFVFSPKYRKPVLRGDVAMRVRDQIREIQLRTFSLSSQVRMP